MNQTVLQQKSVSPSTLRAPEKESGMTYNVNGISHTLHMLQSFSAKENLTKFSGFSHHMHPIRDDFVDIFSFALPHSVHSIKDW